MSIELRNITKTFGSFKAVKNISLQIATGELMALLGPSGSGKTTLLRMIAGLETADSGQIFLNGEDATHQSARERGIGFVFQHYALFRHMTVFENVAFGLRVRPRKLRPSEKEIRYKVGELLKLVQLEEFASRLPSQLSGGQSQRVALARALAVEPKVLLLDEPFGALDAKVRQELRSWLRRIHDELHITTVFVTHDQEEALEVADRVVVMNSGAVEQVGTPTEVYHHPVTAFVYNFLGRVNRMQGLVNEGRVKIGDIEVAAPEHFDARDALAICFVRPQDIAIERHVGSPGAIEAIVRHIHMIGAIARVNLKRRDTGEFIEAEISNEKYRELALQVGESVFVRFQKVKVFLQEEPVKQRDEERSETFTVGAPNLDPRFKLY